MGKLWQLSQGHPKPAFSVKVQKGDGEKFFKNRPKSSPRLKGKKTLWRKLNYTLIKMHLKCKDWKIFWRKQRLQKYPNGQVMAIFARSQKPAFSEKVQRGNEEKFLKNHPKSSPCLKGLKALLCKLNYTLIKMHLKCKEWKRFCQKQRLQNCPKTKLWQFWQGHPKPAFSKKSTKGGPKEIFQKSPKK